jgi:hypothetical protein
MGVLLAAALLSVVVAQQAPDTWVNVTPSDCNPGATYDGVLFVATDPARPTDAYFQCDAPGGFWRSTDYGVTWTKVNTGVNGSEIGTGRAWGGEMDQNPNRDPSTDPNIYVTLGYGANGVWKSTDGGVNWTDVWKTVYAPDGVTNIFSDLGRDICWILIPDTTDGDRVLTCLHSYWGSLGYNDLYETTNGGETWKTIVVPFEFSGHGDIPRIIDKDNWIVSHGWPGELWHTGDAGVTWAKVSDYPISSLRVCNAGGATYASGSNGLYKSTDKGRTWSRLANTNSTSTVVATATTLYTSQSPGWDADPCLRHAPLDNDEAWVDDPWPHGMLTGAFDANVTFDGTNYVIITGNHKNGVWRYVEPSMATSCVTAKPAAAPTPRTARTSLRILTGKRGMRAISGSMSTANARLYDIRGKVINRNDIGRQAVVARAK